MKGASAVNFIIAELLVFRCGVKDSSKNLQTHINENNGENYMNIRFLSQIVLQVTGLIYATVKYRNKILNTLMIMFPE